MASRGRRVALVGATGAVGRELLSVLEERRFPVAELVPIAGTDTAGSEVEIFGEALPVTASLDSLRGLDLVWLCCPAPAALDWIREALRAEVPLIDASGALSASPELPLVHAVLGLPEGLESTPALASPVGPVLGWAAPLAALHAARGLESVTGTVLRSVSWAGRGGIESLTLETVSLLNQQEPPEPTALGVPAAFEARPLAGQGPEWGGLLARLLGVEPGWRVGAVQVPSFVGDASDLWIETGRTVDAAAAREILEAAPGVACADGSGEPPGTRAAVGREEALVWVDDAFPGPGGLRLWIVADGVRLAAANAVALAEARLGTASGS